MNITNWELLVKVAWCFKIYKLKFLSSSYGVCGTIILEDLEIESNGDKISHPFLSVQRKVGAKLE
jgi:hypothetical protein